LENRKHHDGRCVVYEKYHFNYYSRQATRAGSSHTTNDDGEKPLHGDGLIDQKKAAENFVSH
jgi:hypothetical protein